jgi:hypothetical protein
MTDATADDASGPHEEVIALRKEASAMALYVAICLLAALTALPESAAHTKITPLIWGVTVGLAVVHWFAFRVSARLVASGRLRPHDVELAGPQLVGAVGVALLATVPVVLLPESAELEGVALSLATFIALVGYAVPRGGGAARARALLYALTCSSSPSPSRS